MFDQDLLPVWSRNLTISKQIVVLQDNRELEYLFNFLESVEHRAHRKLEPLGHLGDGHPGILFQKRYDLPKAF